MLNIDLRDQSSFPPNAQLKCRVSWDLLEAADSLELRLVWNTVGKGTQDMAIARHVVLNTPTFSGHETVSMQLPGQPYSFSGKLVSIVWAIELVALPSNESTRVEITIGPEGREVVLKDQDVSA